MRRHRQCFGIGGGRNVNLIGNNFRSLIDITCLGVMMTFVGPLFGCAVVNAADGKQDKNG